MFIQFFCFCFLVVIIEILFEIYIGFNLSCLTNLEIFLCKQKKEKAAFFLQVKLNSIRQSLFLRVFFNEVPLYSHLIQSAGQS